MLIGRQELSHKPIGSPIRSCPTPRVDSVQRKTHQEKGNRAQDNTNDNGVRHWRRSAPNHWRNQHDVIGERVECIHSFRRSPRPKAKGHGTDFPLAREDTLRFAYGAACLGVALYKALRTPTDPSISTSI
jgi:hypothetical protein